MQKSKIKKTIKNLKLHQDKIFIFLSFLIPFYIYCYTLCPTVSVYADAGEYPTLAYVSGFAHPPGYPLFILIIKLFQQLPFGNPALKANLVAAFFGALTIPIFYLLTKKLTKNSVAAFAAGLTLAFSRIYWRNSVVSEVFTLLAFFIVLTFYLFLLWQESGKKKYFYWFLVACGFGLAHHQIIIFTLFPLLIWFLIKKGWKKLCIRDYLFSPFLVAIGFLPYIYIWQVAKNWPLMNWENPVTLTRFFRLITRASYGTFILTQMAQKTDFRTQASGVFNLLIASFSPLGIGLFFIGLITTLKLFKPLFFILTYLLIFILLFAYHSGMPLDYSTEVQFLERFLILILPFVGLAIGFCLSLIKPKTLTPLLILLPISLIGLNFGQVNQRNNYFGEYLAEDFLSVIPPNSLLAMEGDTVINSLFYYRFALNQRQDVALVLGHLLNQQPEWYINEIKSFYPDLIIPEDAHNRLPQFFNLNSFHKNIYLYLPGLMATLNLNIPTQNKGLIWQYLSFKNTPLDGVSLKKQIIASYANYKNLALTRKFPFGWPESSLINIYAEPYLALAQSSEIGFQESEQFRLKALEIAPGYYLARSELGDFYQNNNLPEKALVAWQQALQNHPDRLTQISTKNKIKNVQEIIKSKNSKQGCCGCQQ